MAKVSRYAPVEIRLTETGGVPRDVQFLRVGKFNHPRYGVFEITRKTLADMKASFDHKVRRIDPAIDYSHESEKIAAGWPKGMELREDGDALYFTEIEWTPRARQMLVDKELRYFSPDFATQWQDPETGVTFENVVFGGGLTNRPFVKGMEPVISLGEEIAGGNDELQACVASIIPDLLKEGMSQEQAIAIAYSKCGEKQLADLKRKANPKGGLSMDEKDKKIAELEAKVAELMKALEAAKGGEMKMAAMKAEGDKLAEANKKLSETVAALEVEAVKTKKEGEFNMLLSEGKACAAQKDAFMKGDMSEFAKLAQPINLAERGAGTGTGASGNDEDETDKVLRLADEKIKADPKLDRASAVRLVLSETKNVAK